MKATEQYFLMLYKVVFTFKVIEQNFPVVLFIMQFKIALTIETVDKILKCRKSVNFDWWILKAIEQYIPAVLFKFPKFNS